MTRHTVVATLYCRRDGLQDSIRLRPAHATALLACLVAAECVAAATLFDDSAALDITLRGELTSLIEDVDARNRHAVTLDIDGEHYPIEARVRGKSRARVCEFPPLRLYFDIEAMSGSVFEGQRGLKLVTHCRNYDRAEADLFEEYTAYRILNAVTEASYRVRLVRIQYADTEGRLAPEARERHGILLESLRELAGRLGGEPFKVRAVTRGELDEDHAALIFVFQYAIGNTDWSLVSNEDDDECCHNIDLVSVDGRTLAIPFDFDLAGIVDPPYARPDPSLGTRSVRQRRYRGYCVPEEPLERAIKRFLERRDAIDAVVRDVPADEKYIRRTADYLDKFFRMARDPDRLLKRFEKRCL
jgi:hypothetical protein